MNYAFLIWVLVFNWSFIHVDINVYFVNSFSNLNVRFVLFWRLSCFILVCSTFPDNVSLKLIGLFVTPVLVSINASQVTVALILMRAVCWLLIFISWNKCIRLMSVQPCILFFRLDHQNQFINNLLTLITADLIITTPY